VGTKNPEEVCTLLFEATKESLRAGERITEITLRDRVLRFYWNPAESYRLPVPVVDLAEVIASSITGTLLAMPELDVYWDTAIVECGDIGRIVADKTMIRDDGYGRYFKYPIPALVAY